MGNLEQELAKSRQKVDTKVDRHRQICKKLNRIYERKNNDYGNSFSKSFEEYGPTMCAIRLEDKLNRFKQLIKSNYNPMVTNESIDDTLLDLANYAIMTLIELENSKGKLDSNSITVGQLTAEMYKRQQVRE